MGGLGSIYNKTDALLREHATILARLQEQAASGVRVQRASDAPTDAFRILKLRAQVYSLDTYSRNLDDLLRNAEMSYSVLQEVSNTIIQASQSLSMAVSGTQGQTTRTAVAEQIDTTLEHVLSLANTKSLGRYIFSGTNAPTAPFEVERTGEQVSAVRYSGSLDDYQVPVAPGVKYPGGLIGDTLFRAHDRGEPEFLGDTGAGGGSGTSSIRGDVYLVASHDTTTYAGASGIVAAASSADADTILADHVLTVTAATKMLSLDGGPLVAFQGTEQDLTVANAAGDVVHVNVENWAGFDGDIAVSATARLTIDGGDSYTDVSSFTDNVAVTDSASGRVLYVNATGLTRTGTEAVCVPGTHDLFTTLIIARDLLRNEAEYPRELQVDLLRRSLDAINEVAAVVAVNMTYIGGRLQAMDVLGESLETVSSRCSQQAAALEDADLVQVATDLARRQTLYELALAIVSRLLSISLLDYM